MGLLGFGLLVGPLVFGLHLIGPLFFELVLMGPPVFGYIVGPLVLGSF